MLDKGGMLFKSLSINQPLAIYDYLMHGANIKAYNIYIDFLTP